MVSTVSNRCGDESHTEPEPSCSDVRSHDDRSEQRSQQVTHDVFYRVSVDRYQANRGGPFMMPFVDVFVQARMM